MKRKVFSLLRVNSMSENQTKEWRKIMDSLKHLRDDYEYSIEYGMARQLGLTFVEWALSVHDINVTEEDTDLMYAMGITSDDIPF